MGEVQEAAKQGPAIGFLLCPNPHNLLCAAICRYPSGESYMDVIQRLEPVVTGGAGWDEHCSSWSVVGGV